MLGANAYQPENPKQRPFPYKDVHDWLVNTGKHRESGGGGLTLQYSMDAPGQLVPTIHYAGVYSPAQGFAHAGKWVLRLNGEFGSDAGTVSVNGIKLTLLEPWNNMVLYVELPSLSGPASYGDIVVDVRNHKSNAAPLTKWTGTVSQVQIGTDIGVGSRLDISCPVQISQDVHFTRSQPAETPQYISSMLLESTGPCNYTHSGTWFVGVIRYDISGSGTVSSSEPMNVVGSLFASASAQTLPIELQGGIANTIVLAPGTLRITYTPDGSYYEVPAYGSWAHPSGVTLGTNYSFTKTRPCIGPTQCTETWSLQPVSNSTPLPDTES